MLGVHKGPSAQRRSSGLMSVRKVDIRNRFQAYACETEDWEEKYA